MSYSKQTWTNNVSSIDENKMNHIENGIYNNSTEIEEIKNKIKTSTFTINVIPSTARGSMGYGETSLDISSLNATNILGLTFHDSSNFMIWGTSTNISTNPSSLNIYGYRASGTYSESIAAQIQIIYK